MKRIGLIIAALGIVGVSAAQNLVPVNTSFRLGFSYPLEDSTRSLTGNMADIGIDFNSSFSLWKDSEAYVSLDYIFKTFKGRSNSIVPIMFNQRFVNSTGENGARSYFFVGAGPVNIDITTAKWVYGVRGGLGMDFSEKLFAEVSAMFTTDAAGAKGNSLGVSFGYRF